MFQCRETNDSGFVREQHPVCDLQAVEMKFKGGGYTKIVRFLSFFNYYHFQKVITFNSIKLMNEWVMTYNFCSFFVVLFF